MFPGYLFVHDALDKAQYIELLKVRGIVRVLEDGWTRLTPIPNADIEAIRIVMDANVDVRPHPHLTHGDRVRVIEGPLTGVEGIFVRDRTQQGRLVLSVDLLGRSVSVEIDDLAIEPVSNTHPSRCASGAGATSRASERGHAAAGALRA
jgi:transcription antitermination factor NusG